MIKNLSALVIASLLLVCGHSLADEVKDTINQALAHYDKDELSAAVTKLDYAASLIRQQKAEQIKRVFPEPLAGWQANEAEAKSAGASLFGGGISASRSYYQGEEKSVLIKMAMDSPMLQAALAMLNNPAMLSMTGAKLTKIQGQNAMLKSENGDVEISLIVNGNAMFTISGDGVTEAEVRAFAEAIKLDQLGK